MKPYLSTFVHGRDGIRREEVMAENAFDARKAIRAKYPNARYVTAVCIAVKP